MEAVDFAGRKFGVAVASDMAQAGLTFQSGNDLDVQQARAVIVDPPQQREQKDCPPVAGICSAFTLSREQAGLPSIEVPAS